ncbi:MAG: prolipoprotein diacylglyceryl transferase [Deltaproteobacteria bacterium]|nr:MAG: prolipoprotein diacylglyceryl transferase [Deltaproteobacteria bacterium]
MHPVFFHFEPLNITIHTYGVMAAAGFFLAIMTASFFAEKEGIKKDFILDLSTYIIISAIIGARVFYLFVDPSYFFAHPIEIFKIWKGGLVFYGGFIFAAFTALIFIKLKGLPLGKISDIAAPSLAIGHAVGRIGCFFAGCCYGRPTDLPIGIIFKDEHSLAPLNACLHPTQLYSVISNFLIFIIMVIFFRLKKRDGDVFLLYLFLYGISRTIIEYFRGDNRGELFFGILSLSQFIGITASSAALLIFIFQRLKKIK